MKRFSSHPERGGVMLYILLAIALLAALSFFVSRGSRTNTNMLTDEQAKLAAQEIIQYGNTVTSAVQKLKLRGFKDTEIDFGNEIYKKYDESELNPVSSNPNCSDSSCNIFGTNGGNIQPSLFTAYGYDTSDIASGIWGLPGHAIFRAIKMNGVGTDEADVVMQVLSLKPEICKAINKALGTLIDGESPDEDYDFSALDGTITTEADGFGEEIGMSNQLAVCVDSDVATTGKAHFIQVLIAR